jgi:2-polyprenyl-3-methyl-5-hydroxy-6-metoxy-1,4-benzoquinol methylase
MKQDYSEYLSQPGMLEYIESEWLKNPHIHDAQAAFVNDAIDFIVPKSIIEFGCSTGNLAMRIDTKKIKYLGIDQNEQALLIAQYKNSALASFLHGDIRNNRKKADLVIAFAFLKHFSLEELPTIMKKLKQAGKFVIFDMPYSEEPKDDGIEHFHTWCNPVDFFGVHPLKVDQVSNYVEPIYLIEGGGK